ncbi:hypothetical protein F511_43922 [Dorcoceras hygrometricum]|uniref:Uncharacterized protein n=1 Tax=Dorcoceras hygrometricum TaxID=472368 RepID=A0A2Z7C869_9LAMI|nr:hypothetical protein F511_43922 [Dorcoceras hygrometricum]
MRSPCLDWSRREDIQNGTVRGRLSWTGRRYLAETLVGNQLGMEQSWSLKAAQEQERTEQAQLQIKRGADAEVAQLEDKNKEAGEEKKRALYELKATSLTKKQAE